LPLQRRNHAKDGNERGFSAACKGVTAQRVDAQSPGLMYAFNAFRDDLVGPALIATEISNAA
jgi:hypothetical protein